MHPRPIANDEFGAWSGASARERFRRSTRDISKGHGARERCCTRAAGGRRLIAVIELVIGQIPKSGYSVLFESRERGKRKPTHVDFVGSKASGGVDRNIVRNIDVRELRVPVILALISEHDQHFGPSCVSLAPPRR